MKPNKYEREIRRMHRAELFNQLVLLALALAVGVFLFNAWLERHP